jgi:CheY-like chemotaxis protein
MLEDFGCDVKTPGDGQSAQANLAAMGDKPVLVLCDLWLSDNENGIELLRAIIDTTRRRRFQVS